LPKKLREMDSMLPLIPQTLSSRRHRFFPPSERCERRLPCLTVASCRCFSAM
jgi:hypothetical protein